MKEIKNYLKRCVKKPDDVTIIQSYITILSN